MNQYAFSKHTLEKECTSGVCLRLFNVYGPNEYHKGRMASTVFHWYNQLNNNGYLNIFENSQNYHRDFVYVEDIAKIIAFFLKNYQPGRYDIGSGISTSFNSLADQLIHALGSGVKKEITMPNDLKSQYQVNTIADLNNLSGAGYDTNTLLDTATGIEKYLDYLKSGKYY